VKRGRSPNYPQLTLADAIEKVRAIFTEEHFHTTSREVVAKDLGFQGLNGPSQTSIASLRHYGLLEPSGNGLKVTDDAVCVLELGEGNDDRDRALARIALNPPLFRDLYVEFGPELPSDATLRHWLLKRTFLSKAADEAIRIFRENLNLAREVIERYTDPMGKVVESAQVTGKPERSQPIERSRGEDANSRGVSGAFSLAQAIGPTRTYAFDISIPRDVKGELKICGQLGKEDLERLRKALNGQISMIEAALED
jgi:hypothetical protein